VLVADQDPFGGAPHPVQGVVFFEAFEARGDGGVFLGLGFFGAEGVVGEGVEADGLGLVGVEIKGYYRRVGGLQGGCGDGRHLCGCWVRRGGEIVIGAWMGDGVVDCCREASTG
jgi:hypothetical protein